MLLKCELVIHNRLAPSLESKKVHVTIRFSKKKNKVGTESVYFIVHSSKDKDGSKYLIRGNVVQAHTRFVDEGKCTIGIQDPPYNFIISKAPVEDLKQFIEILKVAFKGEDVSTLINLDNAIKLKYCDLEKPKTTLTIDSKADYPVRESFPITLEHLLVSCGLKTFDVRILKLSHLKVLDLSDNKLSSLPTSLDSLLTLSNLHLANNCFQEFPNSLCTGETAGRIRLLDLSDNQIKYLQIKLLNMKNLSTLKLDRNLVEFLPSNIGYMKNLEYLHISCNKLKILPWSFSLLHLDTLDISSNLFHADKDIQFTHSSLCNIPSLFEISGRYIVKNRIGDVSGILPRMIQQRLDLCKYCPCGNPCISHCMPYVRSLNLANISQSIIYDHFLLSNKATVKVVGYLCSKSCYDRWLSNPNTLFTNKKRKRLLSS